MFPFKVSVFPTPSWRAEGALHRGLAGDVLKGQVSSGDRRVPVVAPPLPACAQHTPGKKLSTKLRSNYLMG